VNGVQLRLLARPPEKTGSSTDQLPPWAATPAAVRREIAALFRKLDGLVAFAHAFAWSEHPNFGARRALKWICDPFTPYAARADQARGSPRV
jgi:hypothetical protein